MIELPECPYQWKTASGKINLAAGGPSFPLNGIDYYYYLYLAISTSFLKNEHNQ
jgi:hypothetical protein